MKKVTERQPFFVIRCGGIKSHEGVGRLQAKGGRKGADTGETSYGGNVPFEKLYEYISMLQYPFLEKTLKKLKKQNKTK